MIKKLLLFVRSLFLNFSNSSKEGSFTSGLRLLCFGMFFVVSFVNAADRYAVATGNWNSTATWSSSQGGTPGASVPGTNDKVYIENSYIVTVTGANAASNLIEFIGNGTLDIIIGYTLNVTNAITITSSASSNRNIVIRGGGIINSASLVVGTSGNSNALLSTMLTSTISNFNISGNINIESNSGTSFNNSTFNIESGAVNVNGRISTINENGSNVSTLSTATGTQSGTLLLGYNGANPFNLSGIGTSTTNFTGIFSTVNYDRTDDQTIRATAYNNLILSGSGTKTFAGATTIAKDLSIIWGVDASLGNNITHTAGSLTLGGYSQNLGFWGGTSTVTGTNKSRYYFGTSATGRVNVGNSCAKVAVTINSASSIICKGASNTFTATTTYAISPSYQWKVNGINAGSDSISFSSSTLNNNDVVTCVVTSGIASCLPSGSVATSNSITMSVSTITGTATPSTVVSGGNTGLATSVLPASYTDTLLTQDFNGTASGWGVSGAGGTVAWTLRPDGYFYEYTASGNFEPITFRSNDNTQFYISNSATQDANISTILTSPAIPISGCTSLSLEFYQYYRSWSGDSGIVEVSANGGAWTQVATYTSDQGLQNNFAKTVIPLNDFANGSNTTISIRFRYTASFDWYWAIDNFKVTGTKPVAYTYTWAATPSGSTAGLPSSAGTASLANASITANPTQTTTYVATAKNPVSSCTVSSSAVVVTVTPVINSFSPTSVCTGSSTSVTIIGNGFTGATAVTFNGVASSFTVNSNTEIIATLPASATTGAISVITAGGTAISASFTVNPLSVGGIVSGSVSRCTALNSTTLTLTGNVGNIVQWESSTNNFATAGTPIANTNTSLTVNNLTVTTYYRAQVKSGSCSSVYSSVGVVTTGAVTATTATLPICNGFTANWNKVTGASSYLIDVSTTNTFSSFMINGTDVGDVSSYAVTGLSPNTQYYYRISPIYACGVYAVTSGVVSIKTGLSPTIAAISAPAAFCVGGSLSPSVPTVTANGAIISNSGWQIETVAGNNTYTALTLPLTVAYTDNGKNIRYFAISGCGTTYSNSVAITVNDKPTIAAISAPTALCAGASLNATAPTVTAQGSAVSSQGWQIETAAGNNTYAALTLPLTVAYADKGKNIRYFAISGCGTTYSNSVAITVNDKPIIAAISAPSAFCAGTGSLNPSAPTVTAQGSAVSSQGWQIETTAGNNTYTTLTLPLTVAFTDNGKNIRYFAISGCGTTYSNAVAITVNDKPTIVAISAPAALCAGASLSATAPTVTTYGSTVTSSGWQIETTAGNNTYATLTLPLTVAFTDNGKNIRYFAISGCGTTYSNAVTLSINLLPAAPDTNTTQPNCDVTTGTITATSLEATSYILTKISDGSNFTNTDGIFSGLAVGPYDVTIQNSAGCISPAVRINITSVVAKQWTGASDTDWSNSANWSPSGVPGTGDCVIIPDTRAINKPIINSNITAYSIIVNDYGILTVNSGKVLTVSKEIIVDAGGSFIFENNSSLLQSDPNAANLGSITYKRITSAIRRYDFTDWSSPIHSTPAFTLHDVSPLTLADKYYSYDQTKGWLISYNGVLPMVPGMGYIIRGPQHYDIVTPAPFEASFIGIPNNGTIQVIAEANKYISVGNPYPSAVDATAFIDINHNAGVDVGSLYFWTHNSPPVNSIPGDRKYYYNTADYAVFNKTGGTKGSDTGANNARPTGLIGAAAAFFIRPTGTDIKFTNDMRVGDGNDQFFKNTKKNNEEKNRLWLNFANTEGAFKQALIGYMDGATNDRDYNYDASTFNGNKYVDFYSINGTSKFTIQARALPFSDSDLVPLGYVSTIVGDFTISIDEVDGFFDTQAVYLEDKKTGKITDLRAGNYTFTTEKGTFDDRFVLRYTNKTLGTGDFENIENGLLVAVKDKTIKIISAKEAIKEITIFDINGKLLYDKKKIGSTELQVSNLQVANQVLLVKVILENGFTTTRKIIFQ